MTAEIFRYFAIATESEAGTPEADPEMYADAEKLNPGTPSEPEMEYAGSMGRGRNLHRPAAYFTEPSIEIGTDLQWFDKFTYHVLGGKTTVGDVEYYYGQSGIFLPTFTAWMGLDNDEFESSGCVADKIELTADKEFLKLAVEMKGQKETINTIREPADVTLNDDYPLAFYEINLHAREIAAEPTAWGEDTLISQDVQKMTLSIENSTDPEGGMGLGSRYPYRIPAGQRNVNLSFDTLYTSNDWIDKLWGASTGPQDTEGSTEFQMLVEIDAGDYGTADILLPRVIVNSGTQEASGRDPIVQGVEIAAYQDTVEIPTTPTATEVVTEILAAIELTVPTP